MGFNSGFKGLNHHKKTLFEWCSMRLLR